MPIEQELLWNANISLRTMHETEYQLHDGSELSPRHVSRIETPSEHGHIASREEPHDVGEVYTIGDVTLTIDQANQLIAIFFRKISSNVTVAGQFARRCRDSALQWTRVSYRLPRSWMTWLPSCAKRILRQKPLWNYSII